MVSPSEKKRRGLHLHGLAFFVSVNLLRALESIYSHTRSEVFTAARIQILVVRIVTPCNLIGWFNVSEKYTVPILIARQSR
jgi:hypothetical protein